jgi:hydroxyacylglutathione hydrolase
MIVRRFFDPKLAQTSYLIGCGRTGSALVIDPNRDIDQYLRAAEAEGVQITHVTETHIHADFVSGARELAYRTGAGLYLSDEGDANWKYAYASAAGAVLVKGGDTFNVGNVRIEVMHTPGHTPEHVSFLITDTAAADAPIGIATGDFVFVGDVGRPDLLERAAKFEGTMEQAARTLFRSLQQFKRFPDWLQIWPGHGAGSACGKGLSAVPHSTAGYERRFNWALAHENEEAFVQAVLAGQPEPPTYFAEMKRINKEGPRFVHGQGRPERLPVTRLDDVLESGALVVDTRHASDYAAAHIPGTLNVPLNGSFTTWAGWLVPYDRDFYLIVDDQCTHCLEEAVRDLMMIGLDRVAGYFGSSAVNEWGLAKRGLQSVPQMTIEQLAGIVRRGDVTVVDVRGRTEWEAGHLSNVRHIPLGYLAARADDLPRDRPVIVHCQSGGRSAIAASVLRASGMTNVFNLVGGYAAWESAGLPVERDTQQTETIGAAPGHR